MPPSDGNHNARPPSGARGSNNHQLPQLRYDPDSGMTRYDPSATRLPSEPSTSRLPFAPPSQSSGSHHRGRSRSPVRSRPTHSLPPRPRSPARYSESNRHSLPRRPDRSDHYVSLERRRSPSFSHYSPPPGRYSEARRRSSPSRYSPPPRDPSSAGFGEPPGPRRQRDGDPSSWPSHSHTLGPSRGLRQSDQPAPSSAPVPTINASEPSGSGNRQQASLTPSTTAPGSGHGLVRGPNESKSAFKKRKRKAHIERSSQLGQRGQAQQPPPQTQQQQGQKRPQNASDGEEGRQPQRKRNRGKKGNKVQTDGAQNSKIASRSDSEPSNEEPVTRKPTKTASPPPTQRAIELGGQVWAIPEVRARVMAALAMWTECDGKDHTLPLMSLDRKTFESAVGARWNMVRLDSIGFDFLTDKSLEGAAGWRREIYRKAIASLDVSGCTPGLVVHGQTFPGMPEMFDIFPRLMVVSCDDMMLRDPRRAAAIGSTNGSGFGCAAEPLITPVPDGAPTFELHVRKMYGLMPGEPDPTGDGDQIPTPSYDLSPYGALADDIRVRWSFTLKPSVSHAIAQEYSCDSNDFLQASDAELAALPLPSMLELDLYTLHILNDGGDYTRAWTRLLAIRRARGLHTFLISLAGPMDLKDLKRSTRAIGDSVEVFEFGPLKDATTAEMLHPYFWVGMDNLRSIGVMIECPDDEEESEGCIFIGCMPLPAPGEKRAPNPIPPETTSLPPRFQRVVARMIVDVPPMMFPQFRIIQAKLPNARDVARAMRRLLALRSDFDLWIEILSNSYEDVDLLARAWTSKVMQFAEGIQHDNGEDGAVVEGTWETDSSDVSESDSEDSDPEEVDGTIHVKAEPQSPHVKAEPQSPRVKTEPASPRIKTEPLSPVSRAEHRVSAQSPTQVKQERSPTPS